MRGEEQVQWREEGIDEGGGWRKRMVKSGEQMKVNNSSHKFLVSL